MTTPEPLEAVTRVAFVAQARVGGPTSPSGYRLLTGEQAED
jgi:hypothetical protein